MNSNINNRGGRRFATWTALIVLTVLLFFAPSAVFAQNYELSQECAVALVGNDHTVTATVTDGSGNPVAGVWVNVFVHGRNGAFGTMNDWRQTDPSGLVQYTYPDVGTDLEPTNLVDTIELWDMYSTTVAQMVTTWTDDPQDSALLACAGSSAPSVVVGGRVTLNAKKKGALTIALCAVDGLDVTNVDLKSIELAGVAPWHSKYKDSSLCPGGKDGVVDLVLKFKNREVVEALESSGDELEDGQPVDLALTGSLQDGTVLDGVWEAEIKKEGKWHWKNKHKEEKKHKEKKHKKDKVARR